MIVDINNDNFEKEVLNYEGVVIVDFYGTWCMPCKMLAPILEKVSNEHNIKLAKVDIDENIEIVKQIKIMSVPTLKIFKNGQEINASIGVINEEKLLSLLN